MSAAQVRLLVHGYTNNFIEPVLGMIEDHGAAEPAVLCDLVPRRQASTIRGLVIVMPPVNHHTSSDIIEEAVGEYGIERIVIRGAREMRTVSCAYNFLIDFPRTLKVLSYPDLIESFKTFLNEHHHSTLVTIVAWERFTQVMQYLKEAEASGLEESSTLSWAELELRVPAGDST